MDITIDPTEVPTQGIHAARIPLENGSYNLIEVCRKIGFDYTLPNEGVLITLYNDEVIPYVKVIDANPQVPYLDSATFHVNDVFEDTESKIIVKVVSAQGSSFRINVKFELSPSPTPTPTPTRKPTPSPTPTTSTKPSPSPMPSLTPSQTPTADPTPSPTPTTTPTPSPTPTATPTPTDSSSPTASPTPQPTQNPHPLMEEGFILYFVAGVTAILVIVGIAYLLMKRRQKPSSYNTRAS